MGCSYYADVVVGVKFNELNPIEHSNGVGQNPMTQLGNALFKGDLEEIILMLSEDYEECLSEDEFENFVSPFSDGRPSCYVYDRYNKTNEDIVLGFSVQLLSHRGTTFEKIDPDKVADAKSKMEDWLKHILKVENMEIGTYVVLSASC